MGVDINRKVYNVSPNSKNHKMKGILKGVWGREGPGPFITGMNIFEYQRRHT